MSFNQSVLLPVSPDEAFALVTEPERLRRWLSVSAYIELRAGGDFRWTIATGSHAAGTVREVEPGRRLVLAFGWDEDDALPPGASTVTIVIEPADDGSRVTLTHEGLNEEQSKQHAEGWEHYLERLREGRDHWGRRGRLVHPGARKPESRHGHRGGARRGAAGAAPPRPGGPSEADAVRGLRRQRPLPPPDGLTRPARGSGRRHDRTRRRGHRREPDLPDRRPGHRRLARGRPRRHPARTGRCARCPPYSSPAPCRSSSRCTGGTSPRPAASSSTSPTRWSPTCARSPRASTPTAGRTGASRLRSRHPKERQRWTSSQPSQAVRRCTH